MDKSEIRKMYNANFIRGEKIKHNGIIPNIDELINISPKFSNSLVSSIFELSKCDKEFNNKFNQLLLETKQRFQKEFEEL